MRRLRAMLEKLSEAVLPEPREAVLRELQRLDEAVAVKWAEPSISTSQSWPIGRASEDRPPAVSRYR